MAAQATAVEAVASLLKRAAAVSSVTAGASPEGLWLRSVSGKIATQGFSAASPGCVVLSGSFNPFHVGHRQLLLEALSFVRETDTDHDIRWYPALELTVKNADKPALVDAGEVVQRAQRAMGAFGKEDIAVGITAHAGTFVAKANLFPSARFVVGVDTARRLFEPRFYDGADGVNRAFSELRRADARFVVAGRVDGGKWISPSDMHIPDEHKDMFMALENFRLDLSSTDIRKGISSDGLGVPQSMV